MKKILSIITLLCCVLVAQAQTDRKYIRDGNRNYHKREFAKAETMYRKAVADNPDNPQAIYNLGCALMMQNKDSAAVEQFQNAAKLEKNKQRQFKSFHNIGVICQNHKMYDDAIKAYQQALRNNPNDNETTFIACKKLFDNGVYVNSVVSPAVPIGQSIIRTSYMATLTEEQIDRATDIIAKVMGEMGLLTTQKKNSK